MRFSFLKQGKVFIQNIQTCNTNTYLFENDKSFRNKLRSRIKTNKILLDVFSLECLLYLPKLCTIHYYQYQIK